MANFYQHYMIPVQGKILGRTVTHGDFHGENIFFDEKTGQISLIDNASLKMSRQHEHNAIGMDLYYALRITTIIAPIKKFLEGFLLAYKDRPISFKRNLLTELLDQLKAVNADKNPRQRLVDALFMSSLEKAIEEINDEIEILDVNLLYVLNKYLQILNSSL